MAKMGRPLKFKTVKELQDKIDAYLDTCGWKKKKKMSRKGELCEIDWFRPATITGLAVALDTSRQTLIDYENKDDFTDTIKRAKQICEHNLEEGTLAGELNPAMAIFSLKNNNRWTDRHEIDHTTKGEAIEGINYIIPKEAK